MFSLKRVAFLGGAVVPQRAVLSVTRLSAGHRLRRPKSRSAYGSVDTERYSSLVKSVASSRVGSRTPETLSAEDDHLYGPVVKARAPSSAHETRAPKTLHPLLRDRETPDTLELESGPPVRIALKRGPDESSVPSVTRVLKQTLSADQVFYLERWKRRMIAELGEEGFQEYSQNLFRQGHHFHSALEDILTPGGTGDDKPPDAPERPPEVQGYLESVSHVLEDVSAVRAIESAVRHDALDYLGIVDCVARYRGVLCVIDWKTSERPKPFLSNTFDNPIQVAAYAGALNNDGNYKYQVENGLIVVAYKDGSPAHAHKLSSELMSEHWRAWLVRLEKFNEQR